MVIIMTAFTLIFDLAVYACIKTKTEGWGMCSFLTGVATLVLFLIVLSNTVHTYRLQEERDEMQNQVNHAVEDGPSDYERKTIREEIFKINEKISEAKRDNNNWLLGFQTQDIVDRIAPVRMIK